MEAKQEQYLTTLSNLSTLDPSTPPDGKRRNSLSGWTDDAISILKKYPQNREDVNLMYRNQNKKFALGSQINLDRSRTEEPNSSVASPELRPNQEAATSNRTSLIDLTYKRLAGKSIRRLDLPSDRKRSELPKFDNGNFSLEQRASPELYKNQPRIRGFQHKHGEEIPKENENNREVYPKLRPTRDVMKVPEFQGISIVFPESRPGKIVTRRRVLSNTSARGGSFVQEDTRRTNDSMIQNRPGEESVRLLWEVNNLNKVNLQAEKLEKKKLAQLKSFNNANLRFERRNFMGISVLSNAPKAVSLRKKSMVDRANTIALSPPQMLRPKEPQARRQYLEKIAATAKNSISLIKNKQYSPLLSFELDNEKELTEAEIVADPLASYKMYSGLLDSTPMKRDQSIKSNLRGYLKNRSISQNRSSNTESPVMHSISPERRSNVSFQLSMKRLIQIEEQERDL